MENLKILILKIDKIIISQIDEIEYDLGEPDCKLTNPCQLFVSDNGEWDMKIWPKFTDQREIMIHSDSILTIVNPKEDHIKFYLELTK